MTLEDRYDKRGSYKLHNISFKVKFILEAGRLFRQASYTGYFQGVPKHTGSTPWGCSLGAEHTFPTNTIKDRWLFILEYKLS